MTTGSLLYLLLSIGMFTVLAVVLAYQSWQQSRMGPEMLTTSSPASHPEPDHAITA